MSTVHLSNVKAWLSEPMSKEVARAVERLARSPDVRHVAVMPDVHLARDVCVGTAVATSELIYPAAVGTDIGCGIAAVAFDAPVDLIDQRVAGELLERLRGSVPVHRRGERSLPENLLRTPLSDPKLERIRARDGSVQFGTLGRGNHFLELQRDDEGRLWLMAHSGSRVMGQAIRELHEAKASGKPNGLKSLAAGSREGGAIGYDLEFSSSNFSPTVAPEPMPLSIDWKRLQLLGVTPDTQVHVEGDGQQVRIGSLLAAVATSQSVRIHAIPKTIWISTRDSSIDGYRSVDGVEQVDWFRWDKTAATRAVLARPTSRHYYFLDYFSLKEILAIISNEAKVPIRVDWTSLRSLGVEPTTPPNPGDEYDSIGSLLRATLLAIAPDGEARYRVVGDHIEIASRAEPTIATGSIAPPAGHWDHSARVFFCSRSCAGCDRAAEDGSRSNWPHGLLLDSP